MVSRMRRAIVVLAMVIATGAAIPASAGAQDGQRLLVTYAARSCPSYDDVFANLARNNIQESLRDLGPDTPYVNGEAITPEKEEPGQPNCTPLVGWRFHLGQGIAGQVKGTWGALSVVSSPYDTGTTNIVTQASTPMLNANGDDTGSTLPGATTVPLTDEQAQRAASGGLWLQGGDVDDPVLDRVYPQQYGFAALRCAVDNNNGDNVETLTYPQGTRHVYCYAYYVTPPPTSGTIIVNKVVDDPNVTSAQPFTFSGNISYTTDHTFSLSAANGKPGSETFYRGATAATDEPWTFKEEIPPGWSLTGLACTSATGTSGTATDLTTGQTSVRLGAGDTVTCTYTDRATPPAAGLLLAKRTLGGVGTFGFTVSGPDTARQRITTRIAGLPQIGAPLQGTPGTYTITESPPRRTAAGHWVSEGATCGGQAFGPLKTVRVTVTDGAGAGCVFTNRFVPAGRLTVRKVVVGATGTARFQIHPRGTNTNYIQVATVRKQVVPVTATGDDTSEVPLGSYEIIETNQSPRVGGYWRMDAVLCDGRPVGSGAGRAVVRLTASDPTANCTYYDQFVRGPLPPNPNPPTPEPPGPTPTPTPTPNVPGTDPSPAATDAASGPDADLAVTKRVSPSTARPGQPVTYTVTVENRGPSIAYDVVVAEMRAPGTRVLRLRSTKGKCVGDRPARCSVGTLGVGDKVTITTTVPAGSPGTSTNRVGAVSSVNDPNLNNNAASATLAVRSASATRPPRVTG
jgi:uncharacterized repeat protein (TIGR01451 family)